MSKQDTYACAEIEELLSAYADGELNNEECAAVQDHVAACPSCAAKLAELDALRVAVAEAAEDDVPALRVRAKPMHKLGAPEAYPPQRGASQATQTKRSRSALFSQHNS